MAAHEFVIVGDVDDAAAEAVRDFAKARGFRVFRTRGAIRPEVLMSIRGKVAGASLPEPRWGAAELASVQLPQAMELTGDWPKLVGELLKAYGIATAADLTQIAFGAFMQPELGWDSGRRLRRVKVLEFMIQNGISFADINPAATFPTEVEKMTDELSIRTINCLLREGITRLEILVYSTQDDLMDIRNFGAASLTDIKASMSKRNIELKG